MSLFRLPLHVFWVSAPDLPEQHRGALATAREPLARLCETLAADGIPGVSLVTCHRAQVVLLM